MEEFMTWPIIALLSVAALLLFFSLIKKLLKLVFVAVVLLLVVAGLWYFWQRAPELPEPVRNAGGEATEALKRLGGEVADKAAEVVKVGAAEARKKAVEAVTDAVGGSEGSEEQLEDEPAYEGGEPEEANDDDG